MHLLPRPPLFQVWSRISVCDWASQSLCNHCMWLKSVPEPMYVSVSGVYVIEEYEILHLLPQPPLSQIWSLYVCVWLGVSVYVWSLYVACVCAWTYVCVLCVCDRRGCNIWIIHCWSKELKKKAIELLNSYCSLSTVTRYILSTFYSPPCLCFLSVQVHFINTFKDKKLHLEKINNGLFITAGFQFKIHSFLEDLVLILV